MLQRTHWSLGERDVIMLGLLDHRLKEKMHSNNVPFSILEQLPKRSAEGVRQYVRRHAARVLEDALTCNDLLVEMSEDARALSKKQPCKPPPTPPKRQRTDGLLDTPIKPPPAPKGPFPMTTKDMPPSMVMGLPPGAISFGANTVQFQHHGFATTLILQPERTFNDINKKLRLGMRDARLENYDGLPVFGLPRGRS